MVKLKTKLEEAGMRTERMRSYWKEHKGLCLLLIAAIAVLGIWIGSRIQYKFAIYQAWQGQNIVQLKEALKENASFFARAENEAEKEVMMQVIEAYNTEHGKIEEDEKYCVYDLENGDYMITSQRIHQGEFAFMAGKYFMCLGDMILGVETEEQEFVFEYMNADQEMMYDFIMLESQMAKEDLDIIEEKHTFGEVTFVIVTVKPKSNFVPEGVVMTPFGFLYAEKNYLFSFFCFILQLIKISVKIPIK